MKDLPSLLRPTRTLDVSFPSGKIVKLPLCDIGFEAWRGTAPVFSFGRKPLLIHQDRPVFAELLILRLLEEKGWEGVWVSSFGGVKCARTMPRDASFTTGVVSLPAKQSDLLGRIARAARSRGGCFDVFAWKHDRILFCEAKQRSKDRLRASQFRWIEAAFASGVGIDSLLVVEWSLR